MASTTKPGGIVIRPRDGGKKLTLATGQRHTITIRRFLSAVLDVEDVHFHLDSAVLLPDFGDCGATSVDPADANRVTGLAAIRSVYMHAEANEAQKILIAGHADRSGSDAYNNELSTLRADNVLRVLQGDRDGWVQISNRRHQIEDYQQILKWVDVIWGWGCEPGAVDNVLGPKTKQAIRVFQEKYNAGTPELPPGFSGHIAADGAVGPQTWGAFFDVYMRVLELILQVDSAALRAKQQSLKFIDPRKIVGCGESHPLTANVIANRRSQIDRRVEVLFFDPGEEPLLNCHPDAKSCKPALCELYRPDFFKLKHIPCGPVPAPTARPIIFFPSAPARDAGAPAGDAGAPAPAADGGGAGGGGGGGGAPAPAADAGAGPAPAPAPAPPAPAPGTIAAGQVVVVRKPHTNPARQPVQLRVSAAFAGTGLFTRSKANIRFFTAVTGGVEISFNGTDNKFTDVQLLAGVTIFADGDAVSTAIDDVELKLTLQPSGKETKAKMTALDLTLDICASRTAAATDPAVLSAADKINTGRNVHVQDTGNHHGRALVIVREVRPSGFTGNLTLAPRDAHVRLFSAADEVAAAGQAVLANPHVFAASTVPAAGLRFWVEGASVSGALRDTGVRLGVQNVEPEGDRVAMTVARLRRLEAKIGGTPAKRVRMGNSPVPDHFIRRGTTANPDPTNYDVDFTSNPPLVLINNSIRAGTPIGLSVQIEPAGVPVSWSVQRDGRPAPDGDDAAVIALSPNPLPRLTPEGGDPLKAALLADAVGSFHLRPFIDCNGNGAFTGDDAGGARIDREPFIIMNVVMVHLALHQDNSVARSANMVATAAGGGVGVQSGAFNIANPAGEGIHMNALVNVTGGGGDGRRGLNQVLAGWVNNESANEDIAGTFTDTTVAPPQNHRSFSVFASNRATATGGTPGSPIFLPADAAPALVGPALLDSGRGGAGSGGETATLTSSRVRTKANLAKGQRWLVEAIDSPGDGEGPTHPGFPAARLVRFRFHLDFRAHLCFWTNRTGSAAATGDPADRLYTVVRRFDWKMRGEWTVAAGALTVVTAPSIAISGAVTSSPPDAAADTPVEVRAPTGLNLLARDARA